MKKIVGRGLIVLVWQSVFAGALFGAGVPLIPNPEFTNGDLCGVKDKDFDEFRYDEEIAHCKRNVSKGRRDGIYEDYNIPSRCRNDYTIDHFIPLSIGGNNRNENLWPEHKAIKAVRENLEYDVYLDLRGARITQKEAVSIIRTAKLAPPVEEVQQELSDYADCGPLQEIPTQQSPVKEQE
ncbi:MAG: HNH endonuclease [Bdellovibrionales bacterium]|nr:HNH endonuclease [Bdellovibrionales bacterium]